MPTVTSRSSLTGARAILSGIISNGATWVEDVSMTEDGDVITGAQTWDWTMTLREAESDSASVLTLTTDDGTLTINQTATATILEIRVPKASLTALSGDYVCDLKSVDTGDTTDDSAGLSIHWGHGTVTVLNEPI